MSPPEKSVVISLDVKVNAIDVSLLLSPVFTVDEVIAMVGCEGGAVLVQINCGAAVLLLFSSQSCFQSPNRFSSEARQYLEHLYRRLKSRRRLTRNSYPFCYVCVYMFMRVKENTINKES